MATYNRCPPSVTEMANAILCDFETHKPLLDAKVRIDFIFAYADEGKAAIRHQGQAALGLCRRLPPKQRAMGRGDAEITLDAAWWELASMAERRALLDHELHHIQVKEGKRDDLGRPVLTLRKHDVQIGWFAIIAERHGDFSVERQQARDIYDRHGQAFWPQILK